MGISRTGWIVAAGLLGAIVAGGFQGKTEKVGVVDVKQVFATSDATKTRQDELRAFGNSRSELLQFVHTYRVLTPEQAQRVRELSIKKNASAAEKAELEKLKQDIMAADKSLKTLQTKPKPTPDEVSKMQELSGRANQMQETEQRWAREFDQEMRTQQDQLRQDVLDRVQAAVADVGKKQGFTIVYVKDVAPYAANDITAEVLKAMNAKK